MESTTFALYGFFQIMVYGLPIVAGSYLVGILIAGVYRWLCSFEVK